MIGFFVYEIQTESDVLILFYLSRKKISHVIMMGLDVEMF